MELQIATHVAAFILGYAFRTWLRRLEQRRDAAHAAGYALKHPWDAGQRAYGAEVSSDDEHIKARLRGQERL